MSKEYKGYKEGNRYLVKDDSKYCPSSFKLIEIIILEITEKAIKIKPVNNNTKWYFKESFNFSMIEELVGEKQSIEKNSKLEWQENFKLQWHENLQIQPMDWDNAVIYSKLLGGDWRLPTRAELVDAYDNNIKGFKKEFYWSSYTYARDTNLAAFVDFDTGCVLGMNKANNYYVRCVRELKND